MNIYEKLIEVRKVVPYLQKDTKGYQYTYVSGSTVLGTLKKKMDDLGLLLVSEVTSYETFFNTYEKKKWKKEANKEIIETVIENTVKCNMNFIWINTEKPDEQLKVPFACFGTQDDISKAFGSALTYSERYFLLKFFNIATDEDDPDKFQKRMEIPKGIEDFKIEYDNAKEVKEFTRIREEYTKLFAKDKNVIKELNEYGTKKFNELQGE